MGTSISVNKQSVLELLSTGRTKPFVIPEYQRPYAWTYDEVSTLFEDVWDFAVDTGGTQRQASYFLGSVVSFENENGEQEIIDGQQRITSLLLLLRAIYTNLKSGDNANTKEGQNFIRKIEPAIWRTNNMTGEVDYSNILLTSRVVNNEGNEILRSILETGTADPKADDNYSKNYITFQRLYREHCIDGSLQIYDFIFALLDQCILLPIGADSQDTALTIFSTLNNRGLQLNDADIFKAKIYNNLPIQDRPEFIKKWKQLEKESEEAGQTVGRLFYYYMFYLRAVNEDVDTTTPKARTYFLADKCKRLYEHGLMDDLQTVLNLWKVIYTNQDLPGETWDNDLDIRKALDVLDAYPNEYWKYPVVTYYLTHRHRPDFNSTFLSFLDKLAAELMTRFLLAPTINAIKGDIVKLDAKIINNPHPSFDFREIDTATLPKRITIPHRNIVRMMLKVYAYRTPLQKGLLPANWQVEHILPQKWQSTFFPEVDSAVVNETIEHIGNKTPFERILNIVASNGYFKKKQMEYAKSKIEVTRQLSTTDGPDWNLASIEQRDKTMTEAILDTLNEWNTTYVNGPIPASTPTPTEEELAMITHLKEKGLI